KSRDSYIAGRRCIAASSAIRCRAEKNCASEKSVSALKPSRAIVENIVGSSLKSETAKRRNSNPSKGPIGWMSFQRKGCNGFSALTSTATRRIPAAASLRISIRLWASSVPYIVTPVTLPPGRARLLARPSAIGSAIGARTMGMVVVCRFSASAAGVPVSTMAAGSLRSIVGRELGKAGAHVNEGHAAACVQYHRAPWVGTKRIDRCPIGELVLGRNERPRSDKLILERFLLTDCVTWHEGEAQCGNCGDTEHVTPMHHIPPFALMCARDLFARARCE